MSLSPPRNPKIGDVWVDPFDAHHYIYTGNGGPYLSPNGVHLEAFDGWELWSLRNEQRRYERDETKS